MTDRGDGGPGFTITVYHHSYLSRQARELHAIVSVSASGLLGAAGGLAGPGAEVIIVDTSGSMASPQEKMRAARFATIAAINAIRENVRFAVVGGTHSARMIYPAKRQLEPATKRNRDNAIHAVNQLDANGGTAIGEWLTLADELFGKDDDGARHALLFTDGKNEHESAAHLAAVLDRCNGRFVCDARGIGAGWREAELHQIVSVLNGQSDMVRNYADMPDDFRELMRSAMNRVVPDVSLRVVTRGRTKLRFVRQVHPTMTDVVGRAVDDRITDHYTGSWSDGRRDYHLCLDVEVGNDAFDEHQLPATVELVLSRPGAVPRTDGVAVPEKQKIHIQWTADPLRYTQVDPMVARYTEQQELGEAVRAGCEAVKRGDDATAVRQLGGAVRLAHASGNRGMLDRLGALVTWDDPATGVVRLRPGTGLGDVLWTESGSRITNLGDDEPAPAVDEPDAHERDAPTDNADTDRACPKCRYPLAPGETFCQRCGHTPDDGEGVS